MVIIDAFRCGVCSATRRLNHTITWSETMEIRAADDLEVVFGPGMDLRPPICDACYAEFTPKTSKPRAGR